MGSTKSGVFDSVDRFVDRNAPGICLIFGVTGMIASTILSVIATHKAEKSIERKKKELKKEKLSAKETFSACWKHYILPVSVEVLSIVTIFVGGGTYRKRNALLATALGASESAARLYAEKVVEVVGEKKAQQIQDKVDQEMIEKHPVSTTRIINSVGSQLCFDDECKIYFRSDRNHIDKAENLINRMLTTSEDPEFFVPLNDFFYELGIPQTKYGKIVGWRSDLGILKIRHGCQLADDGTPVCVISYNYLTDRYGRCKDDYGFGKRT